MSPDLVAGAEQQWRQVRPDLDPSPILIIGRMSRLARFITEELVACYREFGLSESEFDLLATIRRTASAEGLTQSELTEMTFVTKGAVSKRLDALSDRGLVVRRVHAEDGRGRVVVLTPTGRELIDRAAAAHFANERRLLERLAGEERDAIEPILAAWLGRYESRDRDSPAS